MCGTYLFFFFCFPTRFSSRLYFTPIADTKWLLWPASSSKFSFKGPLCTKGYWDTSTWLTQHTPEWITSNQWFKVPRRMKRRACWGDFSSPLTTINGSGAKAHKLLWLGLRVSSECKALWYFEFKCLQQTHSV